MLKNTLFFLYWVFLTNLVEISWVIASHGNFSFCFIRIFIIIIYFLCFIVRIIVCAIIMIIRISRIALFELIIFWLYSIDFKNFSQAHIPAVDAFEKSPKLAFQNIESFTAGAF